MFGGISGDFRIMLSEINLCTKILSEAWVCVKWNKRILGYFWSSFVMMIQSDQLG